MNVQRKSLVSEANSNLLFVVDGTAHGFGGLDPEWVATEQPARFCACCGQVLVRQASSPVDVHLMRLTGYPIAMTPVITIVSKKFLDAVGETSHLLFGKVFVQGVEASGYHSVLPDWRYALEMDRGRFCRHAHCQDCRRLYRRNWWAYPATLRKYLDTRRIYMSMHGDIIVCGELARKVKNEYGDQVRIYELPVLEHPEDGEVLPSDAEWNGVFTPAAMPKFSKKDLVFGVGLCR